MAGGYGQGEPTQGGPPPWAPGYGPFGTQSYRAPAYRQPQLRAADTDREWTLSYLRTAYAEGRLSHELYDTRVGQALTAQTFGELDAVLVDLPRPGPPATNQLAIASLVCGAAQFLLGPLPTIPAIVLGHMARSQIRRTHEAGDGMALAGLLLGWAGAVLIVLAVLGFAFLFAAFAHATQTPPAPPIPGP
jgi:hypothetical protein